MACVGRGLVSSKIVDAPNKAPFLSPPCPEVFDVQIAYTQYGRAGHQMRANLRPKLQPAIEGGAKKRESGFRHVLMLEGEILPNDRKLRGQPALEIDCCFEDIHVERLRFSDGLNVGVFGSR